MKVDIILTPAEIERLARRDLAGATCVVFDVLRATSTIVTALANGARRVFPAASIEEAREWKRDRLPDALLGGERRGVKIEGFDLGNSPREFLPATVAGRDLITTTTNGTVALRACAGAGELHAGALLNLGALAAHLRAAAPEWLVLVCAGSGDAFSLEDALGAGLLLEALAGPDDAPGRDAGQALRAIVARHGADLSAALQGSYNGRCLAGLGLGGDVEWCARVSVYDHLAAAAPGDGLLCLHRALSPVARAADLR